MLQLPETSLTKLPAKPTKEKEKEKYLQACSIGNVLQCLTLMSHIRIMYFFCVLKVAFVANFTIKGKEDNNTMQSHNIF